MASTLNDHAETSSFEIPCSRAHVLDASNKDRPTPERRAPTPTTKLSISTNRLASRTTLAGIDLAMRTTRPMILLSTLSATRIARSGPAIIQSNQDCSRRSPAGFRKTSGSAIRCCSSSASNSGFSEGMSDWTAGRIETEGGHWSGSGWSRRCQMPC